MSEPLLVVCPHCHAPNRLPAERLSEQPACGRCKQALFAGRPVDLGVNDFDAHLNRGDLPLVVDYWAPWCGPCKVMGPQFERAAAQLEPRVRLAKVNTQVEPTLGQRHGIRSIPTMVLFHHGRELARQSGAMATDEIVRWTRSHL